MTCQTDSAMLAEVIEISIFFLSLSKHLDLEVPDVLVDLPPGGPLVLEDVPVDDVLRRRLVLDLLHDGLEGCIPHMDVWQPQVVLPRPDVESLRLLAERSRSCEPCLDDLAVGLDHDRLHHDGPKSSHLKSRVHAQLGDLLQHLVLRVRVRLLLLLRVRQLELQAQIHPPPGWKGARYLGGESPLEGLHAA